ncbi:hypothetical protein [Methanogenium organophilum]|uniref:Uncharacterized protein n=1 Tax=Methanogenium organophilum TaxID=2199 RepID=A0A9X9S2X5_METOG|nr:hypothetical protein [Methanogenium organophilum]WAI00904.1 hypothetical protein OU421_10855 [Methanogenium organophilum]
MTEDKFDLIVPPGVPRKMIYEISEQYDVEVVMRKRQLYFANMEGDSRELIAFRGTKEVLEKVQEDLYNRLEAYISEV